ncbi:MAG: DUF5606 domain-containing protein [Chitinophagaceae bacterium]|jgi:hypothetical protein|nr:DUF5606 domain-containing protein [Chitinophagaceae bacterium]
MEYGKIISVTGLGGLFELISSKNDGAIVKSLEDGTTRFVSSRVHQFSHLESIEIYTVSDNVNLVEIFQAMDKAGETLPDAKDTKQLRAYFEKVFPTMDFERVYSSDMKKMVKWFGVLKSKGVALQLTELPAEEAPATEAAAEPAAEAEAPAKKTRKKKTTEE